MHSNSPVQKSELEKLREKNMKELEALFADDSDAENYTIALKNINDYKELMKPKSIMRSITTKRKRRSDDEPFLFNGFIPYEKRKSSRIARQPPTYNLVDDIEGYEKSISKKHIPRRSFRRKSSKVELVPIVLVEDVTEEMLAQVAQNSSTKVYSQDGTSCHQCRQKTLDTKTFCRSGKCIGVRGQFCGPCLKNRYGEDVAVALKDPTWACPFCRGLCNCSFCRTRNGKRPTGILAPIAFQKGFNSVKEFLENLKDIDDSIENEVNVLKSKHIEPYLLGFKANGKPVMDW